MKTIITVIFFGILAQKSVANGQCQNSLPAMKDLNIQEFFSSNWYATHKHAEGPIKPAGGSACVKYISQIEGGLIKLSAKEYHTNKERKHSFSHYCNVTVSKLIQTGPIVLNCSTSIGKFTTLYELDWAVIETDYSDYALVQICYKYLSSNRKHGKILLLHRSKTADDSKADAILKKHNLLLNQFKKTEGC